MKVKLPKPRSHSALFSSNLPFQGRVEKLKTRYTRKTKHKGRNHE